MSQAVRVAGAIGLLAASACTGGLFDDVHQGNGGSGAPPAIGGPIHPDAGLCGSPTPATARQIFPVSGSVSSTNLPRFAWELGNGGDGATLDICADPACGQVLARLRGGTTATATTPLPRGHVFWRIRATKLGIPEGAVSPTWELIIPAVCASPATTLATRADVDGDGFADYLLEDRVLRGGPSGFSGQAFMLPPPIAGTMFVEPAFAGDVNGDGLTDVFRLDGSNMVMTGLFTPTILLSNAGGTFSPSLVESIQDPVGDLSDIGPAGDVDGDGYADVLVKAGFNQTALAYYGRPNGLLNGADPVDNIIESFFGFGGDLNGDGFTDCAATDNSGSVVILTLGSTTGYALANPITLSVATWGIPVAMVNANADGFADLAVTDNDTGGLGIYLGGPTGLPLLTPVQTFPAEPCAPSGMCDIVSAAGWGDFNGDGAPDLIVAHAVEGSYELHLGLGNGTFNPTGTRLPVPNGGTIRQGRGAIGDVNGDGFDDLVTAPGANGASVAFFAGGPGGLTLQP